MMKEVYEKPTAEVISFRIKEDLLDPIVIPSLIPGPPD